MFAFTSVKATSKVFMTNCCWGSTAKIGKLGKQDETWAFAKHAKL